MIKLFAIGAIMVIAIAGCNEPSTKIASGTYPITLEDYGPFSVPVLELETNGTELRLLMDTGIPTFILEPATTKKLATEFDGSSFVGDGFGGEVEVRNIYDLNVSFQKRSDRTSNHLLLRGLERHSAVLQEIGLHGAINPSQLARFGCIAIDNPSAEIRIHIYSDELGKEVCPEKLLENQQAVVTSHRYLGPASILPAENTVALFDTGHSITVVRSSLVEDSQLLEEKAQVKGGYTNDYSFALASDVEIQLGSTLVSTDIVGAPNVLPDLRDAEIDAIVGWDVLSHSTIIVGRDIPPRIYLPERLQIPSAFSN